MNKEQLKDVIDNTLNVLGLYSESSADLILGTACVESNCGQYLRQYPTGPALGIFQMELNTANDIYNNYLAYRAERKASVESLRAPGLSLEENLVGNIPFGIAMCRIHYLRVPASIPTDLEGQADYWKEYYNTSLGKGTPEKYMEAWQNA